MTITLPIKFTHIALNTAPDLLAACKCALKYLVGLGHETEADLCKSAIARAEGNEIV